MFFIDFFFLEVVHILLNIIIINFIFLIFFGTTKTFSPKKKKKLKF